MCFSLTSAADLHLCFPPSSELVVSEILSPSVLVKIKDSLLFVRSKYIIVSSGVLITQSANVPTGHKRGCMDLVLPELSSGPVVRLFPSLNVQDVPMLLF